MTACPYRVKAAAAFLLVLQCVACSDVADERTLRTYVKAAAAYDSGELDIASTLAREALDRNKRFQPALVLLGKASYFSGNDGTAIAALERAARSSPRAGAAKLWLARAYRSAGRNNDARRACEQVLSADPENIAALRLASIIALDLEDAGSAMAFLDRAAGAAGETGMAFSDRAALRWAAGDGDGAISDLGAAAAVLPAGSAAREAAEDLLSRIRERRE